MFEIIAVIKDNILPFLAVLTALVFVHEMGHYLVARKNGVMVEVFSVGFGPELFGWTAKSGTRWRFSAIPLGGYVKMFGDSGPTSSSGEGLEEMAEADRAISFHHKPLGQRAAIVAAGPIANFLFAIILLAGLYSIVGQNYASTIIDHIQPGSAADISDLAVGDRIIAVDGDPVDRFDQLQQIIRNSAGREVAIRVDRAGDQLTFSVTPRVVEETDSLGNQVRYGLLGVRSEQVKRQRHNPPKALLVACQETWSMIEQTLAALGQMISGARSTDELGGPIRIAQISGIAANSGFDTMIWLTALLSINLGLINLFPIPVLDGGHLVFYLAEAVRGRPLGLRVREYASMAGLTAVIALMIFVTWNDLVQLRVFELFGS